MKNKGEETQISVRNGRQDISIDPIAVKKITKEYFEFDVNKFDSLCGMENLFERHKQPKLI